jgi:hypothetical protein
MHGTGGLERATLVFAMDQQFNPSDPIRTKGDCCGISLGRTCGVKTVGESLIFACESERAAGTSK